MAARDWLVAGALACGPSRIAIEPRKPGKLVHTLVPSQSQVVKAKQSRSRTSIDAHGLAGPSVAPSALSLPRQFGFAIGAHLHLSQHMIETRPWPWPRSMTDIEIAEYQALLGSGYRVTGGVVTAYGDRVWGETVTK